MGGRRQSSDPMPRRCWLSCSYALCRAGVSVVSSTRSSLCLPVPSLVRRLPRPGNGSGQGHQRLPWADHTVDEVVCLSRPHCPPPARFWLLFGVHPGPTPVLPSLALGLASLRLQALGSPGLPPESSCERSRAAVPPERPAAGEPCTRHPRVRAQTPLDAPRAHTHAHSHAHTHSASLPHPAHRLTVLPDAATSCCHGLSGAWHSRSP